MTRDRLTEPVASAPTQQRWGDEIAVEDIDGVPFRMYASRPHRLDDVLPLAAPVGIAAIRIQGDRVLTYDGLANAVGKKSAHLLDLGIEPLDRVLLLGFNSPDWIVNFWACVNIGAVPVLANAWWGEAEVRDAIVLLQPHVALADARGAKKLPAGSPTRDLGGRSAAAATTRTASSCARTDEPTRRIAAIIVFTSGTGGRPKAVVLPHRSLLANLQMLLNMTRRLPIRSTRTPARSRSIPARSSTSAAARCCSDRSSWAIPS